MGKIPGKMKCEQFLERASVNCQIHQVFLEEYFSIL